MKATRTCARCGWATATSDDRTPVLGTVCPRCILRQAFDDAQQADTPATLDAPSPPEQAAWPHLLGDYEVLGLLGSGGMGTVYKARQKGLDRLVAVKVLGPGVGREEMDRFFQEARAAARLRNPNIIPIHEVSSHEGRCFYAMDLVEGGTFAEAVDAARLPLKRGLEILVKVARSVHYANENGVVHRDLKPANIMLDARGEPMVTDFGLAKDVSAQAGFTQSGQILGTPSFMAPEQARAGKDPIDAQTDVYGLGATLYYVLTGQAPHPGTDSYEVIYDVVNSEPRAPRSLNPAIPNEVETICLKAISKEKTRRYSSAAALADDLERYLRGEPIQARPASFLYRVSKTASRHKSAATAIACACLAIIGVLVYFLGPAWIAIRQETKFVWPAGRCTLKLQIEGFDPYEGEVQAVPWRTVRWDPPLKPDHGYVEVRTQPSGAAVTFVIQGKRSIEGNADGSPIRVPKGTHEIQLRLADHENYSGAVHIPEGGTIAFERQLVHETGRLNVAGEPDGVRMTLVPVDRDGHITKLGTYALPVDGLQVPTGSYSLTFERENHFLRRTTISVGKVLSSERAGTFPESDQVWVRDRAIGYAHASLNPMKVWSFNAPGRIRSLPQMADFDGDGVADAAVAISGSGIYALSGRDGRVLWRVGSEHTAINSLVVADLDGDGVADVVGSTESGYVLAYSGNGGNLLWQSCPRLHGFLTLDPKDMDGDGIPDFVLCAEGRVVALSGAQGTVLWSREFPGMRWVQATPVDFKRTGHFDLLLVDSKGGLQSVSGKTGETLWEFKTGQEVVTNWHPGVADLDGGGYSDVVILAENGTVYALSGRNGSMLWQTATGGTTQSPVVMVDLNSDGIADCFFTSNGGKAIALSGKDGKRLWETTLSSKNGSHVSSVLDVNGDGIPDIILPYRQDAYALSGRDGQILWRSSFGTGGADDLELSVVSDFDGDGKKDVVVTTTNGMVVGLSGGDGSRRWEFHAGGEVRLSPTPIELHGAGFDGCLVTTTAGEIHALRCRDDSPLWRVKIPYQIAAAPAVADLDGDGEQDCIIAAPKYNEAVLVLSGKDGVPIWKRKTEDFSLGSPVMADLDNDGIPDCIIGGYGHRVLAISGKDGSLLWRTDAGGQIMSSPSLGDFDGDGIPDCIVGSYGSNVTALSGKSGKQLWRFQGGNWVYGSPAIADLNGDGVPDCVVGSFDSNVYALSGRDGKPIWQFKTEGRVSSAPALGDLDGDGVPDCVVTSDDGQVYAISGRTGKLLWKFAIGDPQMTSPVLADLDGDGVPDCIVGSPKAEIWAISGRKGSFLWHARIRTPAKGRLLLHDVDGDGIPDVIIGTEGREVCVLSGLDGELLRIYEGAEFPAVAGNKLFVGSAQWSVSALELRAAKVTLSDLVQTRAWKALLRRADLDCALKAPADRRLPLHFRGRALLELGKTGEAIRDFREAARLGLRSPALQADWIEAGLRARIPLELAEIHPLTPGLLLSRMNRVSNEQRKMLSVQVTGNSPSWLLLAGKRDECLKALEGADLSDPSILSLKSVALEEKGKYSEARQTLESALRLSPSNQWLKQQFANLMLYIR